VSRKTKAEEPGTSHRGFIQISVPEEIYGDVVEFIAERLRAQRKRVTRKSAAGSTDSSREIWEESDLHALMDRANPKLRKALVAIARSPDLELHTKDLAEAAGLTKDPIGRVGRAWGGLMSRATVMATNNWNMTELPMYPHVWDGHQWRYKIEKEDAAVIRKWDDGHGSC
jgi:hypothetical protein